MRFYFVAILTLLIGTTAVAQGNTYKTITAIQADTLIKNHRDLPDFVIIEPEYSCFYKKRLPEVFRTEFNIAQFQPAGVVHFTIITCQCVTLYPF